MLNVSGVPFIPFKDRKLKKYSDQYFLYFDFMQWFKYDVLNRGDKEDFDFVLGLLLDEIKIISRFNSVRFEELFFKGDCRFLIVYDISRRKFIGELE